MSECVRACVRMRACVRACVCVCVCLVCLSVCLFVFLCLSVCFSLDSLRPSFHKICNFSVGIHGMLSFVFNISDCINSLRRYSRRFCKLR